MVSADHSYASVVSSDAYGLILGSPRLRRALLPQGIRISPYDVLDYRATLVLHDVKGAKATFHRTQKVRFLQDGVRAILDHAWGDGILLTHYEHSAGPLEDSFMDHGRRHLVIDLKR